MSSPLFLCTRKIYQSWRIIASTTVERADGMDYIALGQRIKVKRKDLRMTQEDLAEKVGISSSFMGHIERGSRVLSVDTLRRLCVVLDVSADDLLGLKYDHIMSRLTDEDLELAQTLLQHTLDIVKSQNHKIT